MGTLERSKLLLEGLLFCVTDLGSVACWCKICLSFVKSLGYAMDMSLLFHRFHLVDLLLKLVCESLGPSIFLGFSLLFRPLGFRLRAVEQISYALVPVCCGVASRRVAIDVLDFLVRLALEQLQDSTQMPMVRGIMECCVSIVVLLVDARPRRVLGGPQCHDDVSEATSRCLHQCRPSTTALICLIWISPVTQQRRRALPETLGSCVDQRRVTSIVSGIHEVSVAELFVEKQALQHLRIAIMRSKDQRSIAVLLHVAVDKMRYLVWGNCELFSNTTRHQWRSTVQPAKDPREWWY
mmetsp:Transcript_9782/g.17293  ORF Transcript_9782/g.17293 Transcript_9782/m.17293 type:complete len:295 (-) Transcript_9782:469-1353(-)